MSTSLSYECQRDMKKVFNYADKKVPWALKYIDAWAKVPAGLLLGNLKWYGDYDECVNIKPVSSTGDATFGPKFCSVRLAPSNESSSSLVLAGICVSDNCEPKDLAAVFEMNSRMDFHQLYVVDNESQCIKKSVPFNVAGYVAITAYSIFAFFMALGFGIDILQRLRRYIKKEKIDNKTEELTIVSHFSSLLLCFSPLANLEKLLCIRTPKLAKSQDPNFACINAIRTVSLLWVILGHIYFILATFFENITAIIASSTLFTFQFIISGVFAVDSFLFLSGFLAYWSLSRPLSRQDSKGRFVTSFWRQLPVVYLFRYIRLTVPYAAVILISAGLWPHLGYGPFYTQAPDENCLTNWWTNLIYINNFYRSRDQCLLQTWYLGVDMQLFLFVPFVVCLLIREPLLGWVASFLTITMQIATSATLTAVYNLPSNGLMPNGYYRNLNGEEPKNYGDFDAIYYNKPYNRAGPYTVGVMLCHLLVVHQTFLRRHVFSRPWLQAFCWAVSLSIFVVLIYGNYGIFAGYYVNPTFVDAIYNAVARTAWALALGWLVIAASLNRAGIVGRIMAWPVWAIPARLSYMAYLMHATVMVYYAQTSRRPLYVTDMSIIYLYCGIVVTTLMAATVMSLAFESPIIAMMKLIRK